MASARVSHAAATATTSSSSSSEGSGGDIFDIEDFTCASPFEKFVSALEQHLLSWKIGVLHPHANHLHQDGTEGTEANTNAQIAGAASSSSSSSSSSVAPPSLSTTATDSGGAFNHRFSKPGVPIHEAIVSLSGRSYRFSLYHSAPPLSASSFHTHSRSPSSTGLANTTPAQLLSLPLRLDHISTIASDQHHLSTWFGVCTFLLLTPAANVGDSGSAEAISRRISKNEASMLLSAVSVAANAAHCLLPVFVAVDEPSKQLYWGRTCYGSLVRFDVKNADEIPPAFRHLSGLTDFFNTQREKLEGRVPGQAYTGNWRTLISASFVFQQSTAKWGYADVGAFASDEEDSDDIESDVERRLLQAASSPSHEDVGASVCKWRDISEDAYIGFNTMWGPRADPLSAIRLTTSWPFFPEGTFVDNAVYSDLDGFNAPNWRVSVEWKADDKHDEMLLHTPLTAALVHMIHLSQKGSKIPSLAAVLSNIPETPTTLARGMSEEEQKAERALHRLTGGVGGGVGGDVVSNPLGALKGLQSSLKAHIEDATKIAAHGEGVSAEYIDKVMKELLDIEYTASAQAGISPTAPAASPTSSQPVKFSFPFLPTTPVDPFRTTPYSASPADPSSAIQLVPYGSLLSRFVFALLETHEAHQLTARTVAAMWTELVSELRFHFETGLPIPKLLSSDTPDFSFSILHQKIQLLQRCIRIGLEKKQGQNRKGAQGGSTSGSIAAVLSANNSSASAKSKATPDWKQPWKATKWSDEQLFGSSATSTGNASSWGDLDDLTIDDSSSTTTNAGASASGTGWGDLDISVDESAVADSDEEDALSDSNRSPEGVHSTVPNTFLLLTGAPMLVPITQEVKVMTSDKFDEQNEMFTRLGSSEESSRIRTEMQTAGLLSDMQAFKAANPGCILEDFVRWHSPKDWRPSPAGADSSKKSRGELSQRMRKRSDKEGPNIWQKLWKSAAAVPASEQKQLFDPAVEGEQILNYFENIEPSLLFSQLMAIALQNTICLFARTRGVAEQLPPVILSIQKLSPYLKNFNRGKLQEEDLLHDFAQSELVCARATSLLLCFPDSKSTISSGAATSSSAKSASQKSQSQSSATDYAPTLEMISSLLTNNSYEVSHAGMNRAQLMSVLSCTTPRTKALSLFHGKPMVSSKSGLVLESAGATTLPKPDWSEFTFFAPSANSVNANSTISAHAGKSVPSSQSTVSMIGTRAYVCLRHSQARISGGNAFPMPKFRYCTSVLAQAASDI